MTTGGRVFGHSEMKRGDSLVIQLVSRDGEVMRLPLVEVTVRFYLNERFRYAFTFGPTDNDGRVVVTYDDVEKQRLESLQVQPWDYKTTIDECDRRVTVTARSEAELKKAIEVATHFNHGATPADVKWWAESNNGRINCEPRDVALGSGVTTTNLSCGAA